MLTETEFWLSRCEYWLGVIDRHASNLRDPLDMVNAQLAYDNALEMLFA